MTVLQQCLALGLQLDWLGLKRVAVGKPVALWIHLVYVLQALIQKILQSKHKIQNVSFKKIWLIVHACIAVRAATIAGDPKPCVMSEKCVRCLWMAGSRICGGRVLQRGDLSWFSRSINSFVISLKKGRNNNSY